MLLSVGRKKKKSESSVLNTTNFKIHHNESLSLQLTLESYIYTHTHTHTLTHITVEINGTLAILMAETWTKEIGQGNISSFTMSKREVIGISCVSYGLGFTFIYLLFNQFSVVLKYAFVSKVIESRHIFLFFTLLSFYKEYFIQFILSSSG